MKKLLITILAIAGIQNNIAFSATEHDDTNAEIRSFLRAHGLEEKYEDSSPVDALQSEARDYLAKREEYGNLILSFEGQKGDLFALFSAPPKGKKIASKTEIGPGMWQMTYRDLTAEEEALEQAKSKRKDELFECLKSYPEKELTQLILKTGNLDIYNLLANTSGSTSYSRSSHSSRTVDGVLAFEKSFSDQGFFRF
jgi:hypothetical protein